MKSFSKTVKIRFEHTDAEGIMFFPNVYRLIHATYEDFANHIGYPYKDWFQNTDWGVPIRKSECEYYAPMRPGQSFDIEVRITDLSDSSFTSNYAITMNGKKHADAKLVHVFVDRKTKSKTPLPTEIRGRLETYQRECGNT
ncbi:MAG: thioesterase family protein [Bdellovibrionota bacterium]